MQPSMYLLELNETFVEVSPYNGDTSVVYKVDYENVSDLDTISLNPFIVYILLGINSEGKDKIYVGKSKNGVKNRPQSHEDKYTNWRYCFVLTQAKSKTHFNDAVVQYLEDKITNRVNELGTFDNTTKQTTSGTVNAFEKHFCDEYLEKAYTILYILGLDLRLNAAKAPIKESTVEEVEPEKVDLSSILFKYKKNNKGIEATGKIVENGFLVFKGAKLAKWTGAITDEGTIRIFKMRTELELKGVIKDNVLVEDYIFTGAQPAATVMNGAWTDSTRWVDSDENSYTDLVKGVDLNQHSGESKQGLNETTIKVKKRKIYESDTSVIPDGLYTISRRRTSDNNRVASASILITQGRWILLKGASLGITEGAGVDPSVREKRAKLPLSEDNVLTKDVDLGNCSPSFAGTLIINQAVNGWAEWKNSEGKPISVYRQKT